MRAALGHPRRRAARRLRLAARPAQGPGRAARRWPQVRRRHPDAWLVLVGEGPLESRLRRQRADRARRPRRRRGAGRPGRVGRPARLLRRPRRLRHALPHPPRRDRRRGARHRLPRSPGMRCPRHCRRLRRRARSRSRRRERHRRRRPRPRRRSWTRSTGGSPTRPLGVPPAGQAGRGSSANGRGPRSRTAFGTLLDEVAR